MNKVLKAFVGGIAGAIFGVALILVLLLWGYPPPKTKSNGGDSNALATGAALMFGVPFGAIVGFIIGGIVTFLLLKRKSHKETI